MTPQVQRPALLPVPAPIAPALRPDHETDTARSGTLRYLWPDAVDLAKQPGLLYRLHAILNT